MVQKTVKMTYSLILLAIVITSGFIYIAGKAKTKVFAAIVGVAVLVATVYFAVKSPKMHKKFKFEIIEKIIKINDDGSTSIIEKRTTTGVKTK